MISVLSTGSAVSFQGVSAISGSDCSWLELLSAVQFTTSTTTPDLLSDPSAEFALDDDEDDEEEHDLHGDGGGAGLHETLTIHGYLLAVLSWEAPAMASHESFEGILQSAAIMPLIVTTR